MLSLGEKNGIRNVIRRRVFLAEKRRSSGYEKKKKKEYIKFDVRCI